MKPRKRTSGGAARLPSAAHKVTRGLASSAKPVQEPSPNNGTQRVLTPQPEAFWNSLDLYSKGLEALGKLSNASDTALDILAGLGLGNLRLLAEECHVIKPDDASDKTMAGFLSAECDHATLVHLREFLRRRIEAVDIVFQQQFRRKAEGYAANVATLSARGSEKLKSLTKLILLYRHDPKHLVAVHAEAVWQSKPIAFEYQSNKPLPSSAARTITAHKSELEQSLSRAIGKRSVQFIRSEKSAEDITVFTFFREFSGVVRNDFRDKYNVHHGCGLILFGLSGDRQRVIVKSGNRDVATAIAEFLKSTFDVEMTSVQDELFADYTVEDLRKRILGDYPVTFGVEIIAASFARSTFGGHGPISLGTPYLQTSIRPELQHLDELSLIDIHSPRDVRELTVTFKGRPATIETVVGKNGSVRLFYDTAGWNSADMEAFSNAFYSTFGVPLNRLLHPARAALGTMAIYDCLFGLANEEDAEAFHEEFLISLIERGLLLRKPIEARVCRENFCKLRNKPVNDATCERCPKCKEELHDCEFHRLERNSDKIAEVVAGALDDADDWQFSGQRRELDGHDYYELRRKRIDGQEDSVCMIITDRPSRDVQKVFGRTGLPLLYVQAHTDERHIYIDDDCSARLSLSYLLSSQEAEQTRLDCNELCRIMLQKLLRNYDERIQKAARNSYEQLKAGKKLDGDSYERDVFNILRSIFPYTYDFGRRGKVEPDGYVCLPNYELGSIEDVSSWNFSYDAKYSDRAKGYDFTIDEAGKIVRYVKKLRTAGRAFFGANNKPRAHVLISNNLPEQKLETAVAHIFSKHGLPEEFRDMRMILMRQEFLVGLYDFVQDYHQVIIRRRAVLCNELVQLLNSAPVGGYLILETSHCDKLKQRVLDTTDVEPAPRREPLIRALDDAEV